MKEKTIVIFDALPAQDFWLEGGKWSGIEVPEEIVCPLLLLECHEDHQGRCSTHPACPLPSQHLHGRDGT